MPSQSLEQGSSIENTPQVPNNPERYLEIERTDVFNTSTSSQQTQNTNNTSSTGQSVKPAPTQQKPIDPIEIVKGLFSAGFTPTKAQIQSLQSSHAGGPSNLTDTWFRIFLQRMLKQNKKKKAKN